MIDVKEALRRWSAKHGARKIARETGADRKTIARYTKLILDDFALEPMPKEESKDVYRLFLERTGRASMIITSNRDTAEWLAMFDDVLLAQSAVELARVRKCLFSCYAE